MSENVILDSRWRKITITGIIGILIYYCILFIVGAAVTFGVIVFSNLDLEYIAKINPSGILFNEKLMKMNYYNIAIIGSLASSLLGSSIFYIRKLYKLCIEKQFTEPTNNRDDKLQSLGTIVYFVFRPFFSIAFAMLVVIGIQSSMISLASSKVEIGNSFPNVCMFINFFIGFSSGKFLKSLEKKSESIVNNLMNSDKNKG